MCVFGFKIYSGIVPAQAQVHCGNNVSIAVGLRIGDLIGHDVNSVGLAVQSLVHALVAGHDLGVGIVDVDLDNVRHLTVSTLCIVQDQLGLLDSGGQSPGLLTRDSVIAVAVAVIFFGRLYGGGDGIAHDLICESLAVSGCVDGNRAHAQNHNGSKKQRKDPCAQGLFHDCPPWCILICCTLV